MKRRFFVLLGLCCLALVSCGKKNDNNNTGTGDTTTNNNHIGIEGMKTELDYYNIEYHGNAASPHLVATKNDDGILRPDDEREFSFDSYNMYLKKLDWEATINAVDSAYKELDGEGWIGIDTDFYKKTVLDDSVSYEVVTKKHYKGFNVKNIDDELYIEGYDYEDTYSQKFVYYENHYYFEGTIYAEELVDYNDNKVICYYDLTMEIPSYFKANLDYIEVFEYISGHYVMTQYKKVDGKWYSDWSMLMDSHMELVGVRADWKFYLSVYSMTGWEQIDLINRTITYKDGTTKTIAELSSVIQPELGEYLYLSDDFKEKAEFADLSAADVIAEYKKIGLIISDNVEPGLSQMFNKENYDFVDKKREEYKLDEYFSDITLYNISNYFTAVASGRDDRLDEYVVNQKNVSAADVVALINNLPAVSTITEYNYLQVLEDVKLVEKQYSKVSASDKSNVTNYSKLLSIKRRIDDLKADIKPTSVTVIDFANLTESSYFGDTTGTSNYTDALNTLLTTGAVSYTLHGSGTNSDGSNKTIDVLSLSGVVSLSGTLYSFTKLIMPTGSKKNGYIEFSVTGKCKISVVGSSTSDEARVFGLYDTSNTEIQTVQNGSKSNLGACMFAEYVTAGTYRIASTNRACYIYGIIIEYYD